MRGALALPTVFLVNALQSFGLPFVSTAFSCCPIVSIFAISCLWADFGSVAAVGYPTPKLRRIYPINSLLFPHGPDSPFCENGFQHVCAPLDQRLVSLMADALIVRYS